MDNYRIIDSLCYLPTEEVLVDLIVSTPSQMAGYSNIFGSRATHIYELKGMDLNKMKKSVPEEELKGIKDVPHILNLCGVGYTHLAPHVH